MNKQLFVMPLPVAVSRDPRRTVSVIIAIDAAAFVAMKPRPVTAERKENRQRDVCVIPHCPILTS
jgi:hypothetical protein